MSDWLYVIGSDSGPVKIGRSIDPNKRLTSLQMGSPVMLRLMLTARGQGDRETSIHNLLQDHRLHGEWFERDCLPRLKRLFPELIIEGDWTPPPAVPDPPRVPTTHVLIGIGEAATYLKVSKRSLYRWRDMGLIDSYSMGPGGTLLWLRDDLDRLIKRDAK